MILTTLISVLLYDVRRAHLTPNPNTTLTLIQPFPPLTLYTPNPNPSPNPNPNPLTRTLPLNPQVPGVFHVVFGLTTPLLGFHDPLHPEFTDALHEWCAPCRPNTLAHTPTLTLALTLTLTLTLPEWWVLTALTLSP